MKKEMNIPGVRSQAGCVLWLGNHLWEEHGGSRPKHMEVSPNSRLTGAEIMFTLSISWSDHYNLWEQVEVMQKHHELRLANYLQLRQTLKRQQPSK